MLLRTRFPSELAGPSEQVSGKKRVGSRTVDIAVVAAAAAWTQAVIYDGHSFRVALFAFANFLIPLGNGVSDVAFRTHHDSLGTMVQSLIVYPAFFATTALLMRLTRESVADVGVAMGGRAARLLSHLIRVFYLGCLLEVFILILQDVLNEKGSKITLLKWLGGIIAWIILAAWACWYVVAMLVLRAGTLLALEAAERGRGRQAEECRLAALTIKYSIYGSSLGMLANYVHGLIRGLEQGFMWPVPELEFGPLGRFLDELFATTQYAGNALAAIYLSGACSGSLRAGRQRLAKEQARRRTRTEASSKVGEPAGQLWEDKVRELSYRGFSLKALLDFYRGLGHRYMEHYEPDQHRTADVVRHAVIPLSAPSGSALASVMMKHEPTKPRKMVTHNWGNLFRDLVAAIVADALEEEEFSRISELLDERNLGRLERWCKAAGKLNSTYWVCAFSVNQHCTICGQNPHDACDTVTGELYPLCDCGVPKVSNTSWPTNLKGESIHCEVNKFDDMMKLLSASDPHFEQVVAIDHEFDLFTRAWCVAELAAASEMGMLQKLKFSKEERLNEKEDDLRKLRIQDMEASRPEDKVLILQKIEDVDAFNAKLKRLLFEDLLPAWGDLDAVAQIHRLARIARWQHLEREKTFRPGSAGPRRPSLPAAWRGTG